MPALCSVDSCPKASRVGGMCEPHYRRARRYGDPLFEHSLECAHCGGGFKAWNANAKYCAEACGMAARALRSGLTCAVCSKPMVKGRTSTAQGEARCRECQNGGRGYYEYGNGRKASHGAAYARGCRCDVCCTAQAERMSGYFAEHSAAHGEHYSSTWRRNFKSEHGFWPQSSWAIDASTRRAIYERDGWVCQLCNGAIDFDATEHADRASLDHIVPQSHGGSHDPSNLRMAHVGCNARRGDRVDALEGVS